MVKMNTLSSCPCRQNIKENAPPCRFVEIFDKLPECPCSGIPSINAGPPCPFKSMVPCVPSPVQGLLQADQNRRGSGECPLSTTQNDVNSPFSGQSQLCVFAEAKPINFKEWPPFICKCIPGTCPEISKNLLRSWGFDPMCNCPCSKISAAALAAAASKTASETAVTKAKLKSSPQVSKTNLRSGSRSAIFGNEASVKGSKPPVGSTTVLHEGSSPNKLAEEGSKHSTFFEDHQGPDDDGPPGGKLQTRGKGFKIYEINGEKVLFNYSTKNCKWLKCECPKKPQSCGCDEWKRMATYRNCCCPGAKKNRKIPPKSVLKDPRSSRPSLGVPPQQHAQEDQKNVKYN